MEAAQKGQLAAAGRLSKEKTSFDWCSRLARPRLSWEQARGGGHASYGVALGSRITKKNKTNVNPPVCGGRLA
jgi:hypothetical protein